MMSLTGREALVAADAGPYLRWLASDTTNAAVRGVNAAALRAVE
jgi:hypothetical protein